MNNRWIEIYNILNACDNKNLWSNNGVMIKWVDAWEEVYDLLPNENSFDDMMSWALQELLNSSIPQASLIFYHMILQNELPKEFLYHSKGTIKHWEDFIDKMEDDKNKDLSKKILLHGGYDGYTIEDVEGLENVQFNNEPLKKLPLSIKDKFLTYTGIQTPFNLPSARFIVCDESVTEYEQVKYLMDYSRDYDCPLIMLCWQMDDMIADMLGRAYKDNFSKIIPLDTLGVEASLRTNLLSDCAWITGSDLVSYVFRNELRTLSRGSKSFSMEFPNVTIGNGYVSLNAASTRKSCRMRASELLKRLEYPDEPHDLIRKRANLINGISVAVQTPSEQNYNFDFIDVAISGYKVMMQSGVCDCKATFGKDFKYNYFPALPARNAIEYARSVLKVEGVYSDITINA